MHLGLNQTYRNFQGRSSRYGGLPSTHNINVIDPRKAMVPNWRFLRILPCYTFPYTGMTKGDSTQLGNLEACIPEEKRTGLDSQSPLIVLHRPRVFKQEIVLLTFHGPQKGWVTPSICGLSRRL